MATHTLGYAPEDPVCLVESCRRAIEWILITHAAHGRLVARPWIDHPYGEEEITLLEEINLWEGFRERAGQSSGESTEPCCAAKPPRSVVRGPQA